jgi:hypothetical protein
MTPKPQTDDRARPTADRREELERIKAAMWPADEPRALREQRIREAVAATESLSRWEFPVALDAETWYFIAESPDVYDDN